MTTSTWRGKTFKDLVQEAKTRISEVSSDKLQQDIASAKPLVILDVREPEDFARGHITGAINLPRGILELEIDEICPDQDAVVIAYCGGGSRSALAADTLQVMGYTKVYSLAGGWRAWSEQHG